MANSNFRININAAVAGLPAVQNLIAALNQLQAAGGPNPLVGVNNGASGLLGTVARLNAAVLSLGAAFAGVGLAFKAGIGANEQTESATLGIKAMVVAMTEVRDAAGNVAKGPQQLAIAAGIAADQVTKLRIAGLETSATFPQLMEAFQTAIAPGTAAGMTLDKIRELTVGIVQAAGAMGVPMDQLKQEVRSIFSGDITSDSTVGKIILPGITPAQIELWKQNGEYAEQLQKRLEAYVRLGPEAAKTWTATMSNMADAFEIFLGKASEGAFGKLKKSLQDAMSGVFDTKTAGISDAFQGMQDAVSTAFSGIGTVLANSISGTVAIAQDLSRWFSEHADLLGQVAGIASQIWDIFTSAGEIVTDILGVFGSIVGEVTGAAVEVGILQRALQGIQIILALIKDGFQILKSVFSDLGAAVIENFGAPLRTVLGNLRDFISTIPLVGQSLANGLDTLIRKLPTEGAAAGLRKTSADIKANFAAGNTELTKLLNKVDQPVKAVVQAPKGTSTPPKVTPKVDEAKVKAAEKEAALLQRAKERLDDAATAAEKKAAAAMRSLRQAELDRSLAAQKISYGDYIKAKGALIAQEIALEEKALQKERATVESRKAVSASEQKRKEADLRKIDGDLTALAIKEREAKIKVTAETEAFERQVEDAIADMRIKAAQAAGDTDLADRLTLEADVKRMRKDPAISSSPTAIGYVDSYAADTARAQEFAKAQQAIDQINAYREIENNRIQRDIESGALRTLQGEEKLRLEREKSVALLEAQVVAMERIAASSSDKAVLLQAKQARDALESLKGTATATATAIKSSMTNALQDGLSKWMSGEMKFKDVLRNVALAFLKTWQDIAAKSLAEAVFKGFGGNKLAGMGGGSGGLDFVGMFSSVFGGSFADGGIIRGPGGPRDDNIPIWVSAQEAVLNARATAFLGADLINWLNRSAGFGNAGRFADGGFPGLRPSNTGLVEKMFGGTMYEQNSKQQPQQPQSLRIINSIDPSVIHDAMDSAQGERVILNTITTNAGLIQRMLARN